jgi:hypothetical protein
MAGASFLSRHKFLIVGGTSKAGTTSVYNYLQGHPQICMALSKETRFFLDADYPLPSEKRCQKDGPAAYEALFDTKNRRDDQWMLDATPDYLHSPGTAKRIRENITNVQFIFLLREPVSRLLSWYRFGQSMDEVPMKMTFDEYVQAQGRKPAPHPAFLAMEQGCYSGDLARYFDEFGRACVHVCWYDDLKRDPAAFIRELCGTLQIDPAGISAASFGPVNKGVAVRNPGLHRGYYEAKEKLRGYVRDVPWLRAVMRGIGRRVDSAYNSVNLTQGEKPVMSPATEDYLRKYYEEENSRLKQLLGVEPPWVKVRAPVAA